MYAKSSPKMIGIMIGFRIKNVRVKIARIRAATTTLFMSFDSVMVFYVFPTYKSSETWRKTYKEKLFGCDMIIKNIFDEVFDDEVHVAFLKFGRGVYKNKYLIEGKKQAKNWAVKAGAEYANFLVRRCLESVGGSVKVTGVIVSTLDLRDEIKFDIKKVKNFQGVRKHVIDGEVSGEEIFGLMDKYPKAFFALSFKGDDFVLKIKPKAPADGKKSKKEGEGIVADFCTLKTTDEKILGELFFGVAKFEKVKISHEIDVTDIVYPDNVASLKPAEIRELAKRKGILKRIADVDGKEQISQAEFVA